MEQHRLKIFEKGGSLAIFFSALRRLTGLSLLLLMQVQTTSAQPALFETSYPAPGVNISFSVVQLPDSSVYLFGYTENGTVGGYDFRLMKLRADGTVCWTKDYGSGWDDFGLYMNRADSNSLILIGSTSNPVPGFGDDILLIKVDSAGQELWRKAIGGVGPEVCRYVEQTADGGFIACGIAPDGMGSNDALVLKTDSLGQVEWTTLLGGPDNDVASRVTAITDSTWVVSCDTKQAGNGTYDVQVVGLNRQGQVLFDQIQSDVLTNGTQGVCVTSTGRIVAFGETETAPQSFFDFLVQVFDPGGTPVRNFAFGGNNGAEAMFDLLEMPGGDYLATGYTNSSSGAQLPNNIALMRMDTLGQLRWFREFGGTGVDIGYAITPSRYGTYYLTGRYLNADEDFYLLHFDANGFTGSTDTTAPAGPALLIYPNPATTRLTLQGTESRVQICTADGRLVRTVTPDNFQNIDIESFEPGIYLVCGGANGHRVFGRFSKLP